MSYILYDYLFIIFTTPMSPYKIQKTIMIINKSSFQKITWDIFGKNKTTKLVI